MNQRLHDNLARVRQRVAAAAERAGRAADEVRLIAVTKYVDLALTRELVECGCLDLGESRPQQLWEKAAGLGRAEARWHLVGHLQRNKVARTLPLIAWLHSLDRASLLPELQKSLAAREATLDVLLEVNISGEAAKHGAAPEAAAELLERCLAEAPSLRPRGLMTMASLAGGVEQARREFARARQLRDRLQERFPAVPLDELSMGMSGDFEAAIEQGATMVRVGSALFEGLER